MLTISNIVIKDKKTQVEDITSNYFYHINFKRKQYDKTFDDNMENKTHKIISITYY